MLQKCYRVANTPRRQKGETATGCCCRGAKPLKNRPFSLYLDFDDEPSMTVPVVLELENGVYLNFSNTKKLPLELSIRDFIAPFDGAYGCAFASSVVEPD